MYTLRIRHGLPPGRRSHAVSTLLLALASGCADTVVDPERDPPCLGSGDHATIQAALSGPGSAAVLCPGAVFQLRETVRFTADGQRLETLGLPDGDARAVLRVASRAVTTAVWMFDRSDAVLSHVIVDGARPRFGPGERTGALIQAGGTATGQMIRSIKAFEPRGWTTLQLHEGAERLCTGGQVLDSEFGPAGQADGTWADGISLACRNSLVRGNTIVDATDGAIVVFGAPGSLIEANTIRAATRPLLGGINMVDFIPYDGDYAGTRVVGNLIDAAGARIHIAIGMGWRAWVCFDPLASPYPDPTLRGAYVADNVLKGDHMRYGYAVDGVNNWTVTDNRSFATHSGAPARTCHGELAAAPGPFQLHGIHARGAFQREFSEARLEMALWTVDTPPR